MERNFHGIGMRAAVPMVAKLGTQEHLRFSASIVHTIRTLRRQSCSLPKPFYYTAVPCARAGAQLSRQICFSLMRMALASRSSSHGVRVLSFRSRPDWVTKRSAMCLPSEASLRRLEPRGTAATRRCTCARRRGRHHHPRCRSIWLASGARSCAGPRCA